MYPIRQRLRNHLLTSIILCVALPCAAANKYAVDWLGIEDHNKRDWDIHQVPGETPLLRANAKWEPRPGDIRKRIYALVSKKSSSYKLATNVLLEMLRQQGIHGEVSVVNFGKDTDRGRELLRRAEYSGADLIFSMGSESAALVYEHYRGGKLPVVTAINKDPVPLGQMADYEHGSGTNIAMTSLNVPLDMQNAYLFELKPDLKNVGLLYNRNHKQVMATEVLPARAEFGRLGIKVVEVPVTSRQNSRQELEQQLPAALRKMRANDPNLKNSIFWLTSSTAVFSQMSTVVELADVVPVISAIPNAVRAGDDSAVLAVGIDRRNNARLAAIYAARILKGEVAPGALKLGVVTPPDIAVNFRVARKLGLKIPFRFVESASFVYDYDNRIVRNFGQAVAGVR